MGMEIDKLTDEITNEQFRNAAQIISQWMVETPEISEIRFQKFEDGVKLDLIDSLFFSTNQIAEKKVDISDEHLTTDL